MIPIDSCVCPWFVHDFQLVHSSMFKTTDFEKTVSNILLFTVEVVAIKLVLKQDKYNT